MSKKKSTSTRFVYTPTINPFVARRRFPNENDGLFMSLSLMEDEALFDRATVMYNTEMLRSGDTVSPSAHKILRILQMCPVNIAIGEDVLVELVWEGTEVSMRWLKGDPSSEEHAWILQRVAEILKACKPDFITDAYISFAASGVVIVHPKQRSVLYNIDIPVVRKWDITEMAVRFVDSQHVYRVFARNRKFNVAFPLEAVLKDVVVFDCFGYKPLVSLQTAFVSSPLVPLRRAVEFHRTILETTRLASLHNATPNMIIEPNEAKPSEAPTNPTLALTFVDKTVAVTEDTALKTFRDDEERSRLIRHNTAQAAETPVVRSVAAGDGKAVDVGVTQYRLPIGYTTSKQIPPIPTRADLPKLAEQYENVVGSNVGVPRSLLIGDVNQKTNTSLLRSVVAENVKEFTGHLSSIMTHAVNALLLDEKKKRRADELVGKDGSVQKSEKEIKEYAEKSAQKDHVRVSFMIHAYDSEDLKQLYGMQIIEYFDYSRRLLELYGITTGVQEPAKDPYDEEFKQELVVKGSSKRGREEGKEVKPQKPSKKTTNDK